MVAIVLALLPACDRVVGVVLATHCAVLEEVTGGFDNPVGNATEAADIADVGISCANAVLGAPGADDKVLVSAAAGASALSGAAVRMVRTGASGLWCLHASAIAGGASAAADLIIKIFVGNTISDRSEASCAAGGVLSAVLECDDSA